MNSTNFLQYGAKLKIYQYDPQNVFFLYNFKTVRFNEDYITNNLTL